MGRQAVVEMLADILRWSDAVRWDVVSASYGDGYARLDRIDRFWIDGVEHAVRCDAELLVDVSTGTVTSVRDRVELIEWRARIGPVLRAMRDRPALRIAQRHCDAVRRADPVGMAADYALDATLERPGEVHRGWPAIAGYFDDAVSRLGDRTVRFGRVAELDRSRANFEWSVVQRGEVLARGRDEIQAVDGFITHQVVHLHESDF